MGEMNAGHTAARNVFARGHCGREQKRSTNAPVGVAYQWGDLYQHSCKNMLSFYVALGSFLFGSSRADMLTFGDPNA